MKETMITLLKDVDRNAVTMLTKMSALVSRPYGRTIAMLMKRPEKADSAKEYKLPSGDKVVDAEQLAAAVAKAGETLISTQISSRTRALTSKIEKERGAEKSDIDKINKWENCKNI